MPCSPLAFNRRIRGELLTNGMRAFFQHMRFWPSVMYAGRLVETGSVRDIFADPRHPYTRALIESLPHFGPRGVFRGITGVAPSLVAPPPGCAFHPRCLHAGPRCAIEAPDETALGAGRIVRCHLAYAGTARAA